MYNIKQKRKKKKFSQRAEEMTARQMLISITKNSRRTNDYLRKLLKWAGIVGIFIIIFAIVGFAFIIIDIYKIRG